MREILYYLRVRAWGDLAGLWLKMINSLLLFSRISLARNVVQPMSNTVWELLQGFTLNSAGPSPLPGQVICDANKKQLCDWYENQIEEETRDNVITQYTPLRWQYTVCHIWCLEFGKCGLSAGDLKMKVVVMVCSWVSRLDATMSSPKQSMTKASSSAYSSALAALTRSS